MDRKVASLIKHMHYGNFNINLQSCTTLDLEYLHSKFNHKYSFLAML